MLRADVADRPHTVRFRADGPLADPDVRFAVDGDVVTVRADRAPGRADLDVRADVTPAGWPDGLAPVAPGAARLTGAVGADGGWRFAVRGDVAPLERPAVLEVDGAGVGRDATATWRVATPGGRDLLAGRVAQRAGVTTLALDGTRSDPTAIGRWGGWPLDGRARGEAVLEVRSGRPGAVALRGDARLDGTLGGRPLEVALDPGGGGRATYADTELTWSPDAAALALASPDATLDAVLASPTRAEVSGVVVDRDVAGAVAWGDGEARANVRVGTADARLRLAAASGGWTAALRARATDGTDAAWTIDATAEADDDGVALRRFTAAVGAGRATATAEGTLWPDLDVRGSARATALGGAAPVALGVRGAWPRVTGRAALPGLTLDVATRGLAVAGVTLAGPGADVANVRIAPGDAGLAWTPEGGYAGAAQVAFSPDAGTTVRGDVRGDANGDGALVATVDARLARAGATLEGASTVRWTGAPWRATVTGDGRLDGALTGDGARLAADLTWAGTSLAPRVAGTGSLRGATDADVTFAAAVGPDGPTVEARADGDALDLVGRAAPDGATLRGTVRDLALPPAWTAGSPLTVDADLDARAGADPGTALGTLRLRGRGLAWDATWRAGPDAALAGDARIDVGAATNGTASGTLAGPLGVAWRRGAAPRIDASLDVTDVAWRATTGRGTLRVAGPWSAPRVTTDLTLAGAVAGSLPADLDVASGAASWRSDLRDDAGAPWAVGALARPAGAPEIEGALDVPDGAVRGGSVGGAPALLGEGRWADLRVARGGARDGGDGAAPDPRLEVVLPLASLGPGLAGDAAFTVRPTPDASWLEGVVRRPRVAGTVLPDAALLGRAGDVEVRIDGRSVLDVRLADGRWRASADALPLVRDGRTASLDVDGEGRGAQGRLRAEVRTPEGDTDVRLDLVRDGDGTRLAAAGSLADGRLDGVAVRREGRWSGGPTLEALPTPLGPTTARATLRGTGPLPSGTLEVTAPVAPQADASGTDASGSDTSRTDASGPPTSARATWTWPTDAAPTGAAPTRTGPAVDVAIDAADTAISGSLWPTLDLAVEGPDGRRAHLTGAPNAAWRVEGAAALPLGPLHLQLDGDPAGVPRLAVGLAAAPDATLRTRLPDAPPATAVQRLLRDGLVARGVGTLSGEVAWTPGDPVAVRALTWAADVGTTALDGAVAPGGSDLRGRFTPARGADATLAARLADEVAGGDALAWRLQGTLDAATLDVGDPADADAALSGRVAWRGDDGVLHADLVGPGVRIDARAVPGDGVRGEATLDGVRVALPGAVTARVDGRLEADGDRIAGRLTATGPGRLQADGGVDVGRWLPARYRTASTGRPNDVTVRLASFDVARLPVVARTLPYLEGDLAATVRIDGRRVIAQATAPNLRVADDPLPLRLEGIGDVGPGGRGVTLGGALAGSPVQLGLDGAGADLSVRMERFPLTTPLEAWLGALETRSEATGVLRATLPWAAPAEGDVRVATERVRLRRDGVSSVGTLAGHLTRDGATLDAAFEGAGRWSLALDVADGALDARFRADDADAAPLLGLAPALARVGAGARGDLTLDARGPLRAPDVDVTTDDLEVFLAGSGYRLSDARLTARDADLRVAATVTGTQPVGGRLEVTGDARATLVPWRLERAALDVRGDLRVPVIGTIREVDGRVSAGPDGRPMLDARGRVGAPARFEGTLWPFDLRARGAGLRLAAPSVWVADAVGDADVRLRFDERFVLSGAVDVDEARFDLGARAEAAAPPAPSPTDAPAEAGAPPPAGGGGAFAFEAFALRAETVAFDEAFGTGTARVDLTLAGTTRRPTLDGVAEIVRGTLDLSGRTFEVREGSLRFDPTRGVYPRITVTADAAFDPRDALAGATAGVRLVEPARGPFTVALAFDAVATGDGPTGFALSLDPTLVSDAVLEAPRPDGRGTVTRPPTDGELAALVTTGRLDPTGAATGADAASSVATTVLDNAVSLLLLDGLQDAFGEALGVDRVRIRTSSVGRALGEDADPFGVSLEVGGYLGEGVFASYEVGRFAGTAGEALANRLAVTYDLGPVALDLSTRLAFPGPGEGDPDQRVGAAVRYEVAPGLAVEGGASLGSFESEARFGVTVRW
ncbi:MAG: translocation/assembly module TamB domain-containing protein [Trueperaceae bacterium]|nr:translocation/assembly module TamB domain-containing protein [Trueperaceae bacterium]